MKLTWVFSFQAIGAIGLVLSFIFASVNAVHNAIRVLIFVGLLDLYIIFYLKEITISEWIRKLTPWYTDRIILIGMVPVSWYLQGPEVAVWFTLGLLNSHLFERN